MSNPKFSNDSTQNYGFICSKHNLPHLCEWICPIHTNSDENMQNQRLREHAFIALGACHLFILALGFSFSCSFLWDTNPTWQDPGTSEIFISSPCSSNPGSDLHDAVMGGGLLAFQCNPERSGPDRPPPPGLYCRNWMGGKISYQKLKYRSMEMSKNMKP